MAAILIRNLPDSVHDTLRRIAANRHVSVEALAREALGQFVQTDRPGGIDFGKLARDRAELGFAGDGPAWTDAMDDPALSRRVLGLSGE
jgi:plasmid stability protein